VARGCEGWAGCRRKRRRRYRHEPDQGPTHQAIPRSIGYPADVNPSLAQCARAYREAPDSWLMLYCWKVCRRATAFSELGEWGFPRCGPDLPQDRRSRLPVRACSTCRPARSGRGPAQSHASRFFQYWFQRELDQRNKSRSERPSSRVVDLFHHHIRSPPPVERAKKYHARIVRALCGKGWRTWRQSQATARLMVPMMPI